MSIEKKNSTEQEQYEKLKQIEKRLNELQERQAGQEGSCQERLQDTLEAMGYVCQESL